MRVTPANWRDDRPALELLTTLPPLPDRHGRLWHSPVIAQADRGYGYCQVILPLMLKGIDPLIPLVHDKVHGSGLGKIRHVVERTLSWFKDFRRIRGCLERCGEHLQAFHDLAAALICLNRVQNHVSHF